MTTMLAQPGKGVRITGEDRAKLAAELKRRYQAGASIRTLADQLGRSYGFVYRILTEYPGVELRSRGGAARSKRGRFR